MTKKWLLLYALFIIISGCDSYPRHYSLSMSHNNLSDSYLYPYRISVNDKAGVPGGGLKACSDDGLVNTLAQTTLPEPPRYVTVEWEHLMTGTFYRAEVTLDERTGKWLKNPPFEYPKGEEHTKPSLIVQWRGERQVVVMLVADWTDFDRGRLDIGEAAGVPVSRPKNHTFRVATYPELRRKQGDSYLPRQVRNYERHRDNTLDLKMRFGCPRISNGMVDTSRLPPSKLPFLLGADGEHIPCEAYFCTDKQALIRELKTIGWKRYSTDAVPPPIEFRDAPNPEPAW